MAISLATDFVALLNGARKVKARRSSRWRLLMTGTLMLFLRGYYSKRKLINILNFRVTFCDFRSLRFLFNEIFLREEYLFSCENETPLILDCGSNIGMSVLFFKQLYPHARVVAFEPGEQAYACLKKNMVLNGISDTRIFNAALSKSTGEV